MLSIGDVAVATGVSRRMLRHWESLGLIEPATIDPYSGYRRYESTQMGRVRTVLALRQLGFGLDDIARLLDPQMSQHELIDILRLRERELSETLMHTSQHLAYVRNRLDAIEKESRHIMMNLNCNPLPAVHLSALSASVRDETEIPDAVSELVRRVTSNYPKFEGITPETFIIYDGRADNAITLHVGLRTTDGVQLTSTLSEQNVQFAAVDIPEEPHGVSVNFSNPPASIADAWVEIDADLEKHGLHTHGVYRQINHPDGGVTLQAGVREL